jgi:hypothetical protein
MRWVQVLLLIGIVGLGFALRLGITEEYVDGLTPGSTILVALRQEIDARTVREGERFEALVLEPVEVGSRRILSPGMRLEGEVEHVVRGLGQGGKHGIVAMVLLFDRVRSGGRSRPISANPVVWTPGVVTSSYDTHAPGPDFLALRMCDEPRLPKGQKLTLRIGAPVDLPVEREARKRRIE